MDYTTLAVALIAGSPAAAVAARNLVELRRQTRPPDDDNRPQGDATIGQALGHLRSDVARWRDEHGAEHAVLGQDIALLGAEVARWRDQHGAEHLQQWRAYILDWEHLDRRLADMEAGQTEILDLLTRKD